MRMGGGLPKQFMPLAGKPILMHTLERFHEWDAAVETTVVLPEEHEEYWRMLCREIGCKVPHRVVHGGETRFHSVFNAIQTIGGDGLVAVHDGVRPFVATDVIASCFMAAEAYGAAIPVVPVVESVREIGGGTSRPFDRNRLRIVQTPQVFRSEVLREAYGQPYNACFTDDASVVEAAGHTIHLVDGNRENIKITTPTDLKVAALLTETT